MREEVKFMSETMRFIDRKTGLPFYANRDDSDAGITGELIREPWTVEGVKTRAQALGKPFNINEEIADRLEKDLANGALVLFSTDDVTRAVEAGFVPEKDMEGLARLVGELNDIAIIPPPSGADPNLEELSARFLFQSGC